MPAYKAMTTKPACGYDSSVDDKELAIAVDKDEEEPLAVDQSKKMPKRSNALGGLREVYQVVVNDNVLILTLI
jgi:hypothetical protein